MFFHISPATISNIERGVPHVRQDRAIYLLEKLGLSLEELPDMVIGEERELKRVQFQLFMAESLHDINEVEKALKKLDELNVTDSHPLAAYFHYIKGKCFNTLKKWSKTERSLHNAIRLASPDRSKTNLESAAFTELGLNSYYQNNLEQAVRYSDSGIDAFEENGERQHFKYLLRRNKAIYLERLGRLGEAIRLVNEVWDELNGIDQTETVLSFYWLRAELSRRTDMTDDAIRFAEAGLEKARINRHYTLMFDFWTVLGSVYMSKEEWEPAEDCFNMALSLRGKFPDEHKYTVTFARLGLLYLHQDKIDQAMDVIRKAIQIGEKYDDAPRLTYALQAMGDLYFKQDRRQEAIPHYERMLKLARKHHLMNKEHRALLQLARCWEGIDEQEFQKLTRSMYKVQVKLHHEEETILEEVH